MDDVIRVQHYQRVENASDDASSVLLLVLASLLDLVEQLFAVEILDHEVDVLVRLEDLVQLQDVRMPNLSEQTNLVVKAKSRLDIALEHVLVDGLDSEFALFGEVVRLKDLGEVALSNDLAYLVLTSETLQDTEVFHQLVPLLAVLIIRALQDEDLVNESYDNGRVKVQVGSVSSSKDTGSWLLKREMLNVAVLETDLLAAGVVWRLELVQLSFEEDKVPLFSRSNSISLQKVEC